MSRLSRREFLNCAALAALGVEGWKPASPDYSDLSEKEREGAPYALGFYFPFTYVGSSKQVEAIKKYYSGSGANLMVIDIKDESGRINFASGHALAPAPKNAEALLDLVEWAKRQGAYLVGRQVVWTDAVLVRRHPELALKDRQGNRWLENGSVTVDLHKPEIADYHATLAAEAIDLGFDEVQLDYVRSDIFNRGEDTPEERSAVIAAILAAVKPGVNQRGGLLAMDSFGYVAWQQFGDQGIGQLLETVGPHIDVLSPMAYPTTYGAGIPEKCPGGCRTPTKYPYEIVYYTTLRAVERLAVVNPQAVVRPWIQAFADYRYGQPMGKKELLRQQEAALAAGGVGAMCWNQRGVYPVLYP